MGDDKVNELQAQVIRLKARVLDAQDESKGLSEVLGQIAQRVGFKGQSLAELVEAVPLVDKKEEADA